MKHLEHLAANVAEVEGVEGLFIMDVKGTTIASMLPSYYDGLDVNILRRRVHAIIQSLDEIVFEASETVLNFGDKILQLSRSSNCIVGVIAESATNPKGMQIATRLMMKKVHAEDIREMERNAEVDQSEDGVQTRRVSSGLESATNAQPNKPKTRPPFMPAAKDEGFAPPEKETKKKEKPKKDKDNKFKGIWG